MAVVTEFIVGRDGYKLLLYVLLMDIQLGLSPSAVSIRTECDRSEYSWNGELCMRVCLVIMHQSISLPLPGECRGNWSNFTLGAFDHLKNLECTGNL